MRRLTCMIFCCFFVLLIQAVTSPTDLFSGSGDILVTIDDSKFTADDYRSWWSNWQEPEMNPPETPDPFIDWELLAREAERMKLYEDAEYRRKALIFLKARTLMLLKAEEVDSKINISEEELWQRYNEMYAPLYQLNILFFKNREDANNLLEKTGSGTISDEQLAAMGSGEGAAKVTTDWYRKTSINPGWYDIIINLEKGKLSDPVVYGKGVVILRLQDTKEGDKDDFEALRNAIHDKLWKEKSEILTIELLRNLREKYHVRVDEERLEKLDINAPDDSFSDLPVVTMDLGTISEKDFMAQVRRMQNFRQRSGFPDDGAYRYKEQVLNGIIDQTLTTREALARGYENRPPFKEVYDFYCRNRMIKALEKRLFVPQAQVTPEEVKAYYEEHLEKYSQPEIVRIFMVEDSLDVMNALWIKVAMGGDFTTLAREQFNRNLQAQDIPVDHLEPEVYNQIRKLTKGELSPVFTVNDKAYLVQLIQRTPAQPKPLAQVGQQINDQLYTQRMDALRSEYLDRLRAGSSITVNNGVWQQLKKEMEQTDAEKKQ